MSKVQNIIADVIIKRLESGTIPWKPTWRLQTPQNYMSKKPYRGLNVLLLSSMEYKLPYYLTFKQIQDLGEYVKPGEKGHVITYYANSGKSDNEDNNNQEESKTYKSYLRYYTVFNVEQTTLDLSKIPSSDDLNPPNIESCATLINNICDPPKITHTEFNPCYNKKSDEIILPYPKDFNSMEHYYSILFHELAHSTGHAKRLNRDSLTSSTHFGSDIYSEEELVAEIGAFMLCCECGISNSTIDNQMAYIKGWLKALNDDKNMVFKASSQAQKAVDYIQNIRIERLVA